MATKKNGKKAETKKKFLNLVNFSLWGFECKEFKNCTVYRSALNNGKDEDGEYLESTPIDVIITKNTDVHADCEYEVGEIKEFFNVTGVMKVEYNEVKKKKYTNIKIFATDIYPVEESDD